MLLYIKEELFNGKIVINTTLEELYERIFKEDSFANMNIYKEFYENKISDNIDEICKSFSIEELERVGLESFDKNDIKILLISAGFNFFRSQGIDGMRLVFISEKEIELMATEVEKDLVDLKDCLTIEEYETILREQLNYHFNINIKEKDIVFDRI